ncbi:MAG: hypothetical protein JXR40_08995, partial [Pontiellaceae bacterium]|nr:hypothetical protein [Pontiellaceae bacterium]
MKAHNTTGFAVALVAVVLMNGYAQTDQESENKNDMEALLQQIRQGRENGTATNSANTVIIPDDPAGVESSEPGITEISMTHLGGLSSAPKLDADGNKLITIRFEGTLEKAIAYFAE